MDCRICYSDFPDAGTQVKCSCGFIICDSCLKRCILMRNDLPNCEKCNNVFNMPFLTKYINKQWINKTYRNHRKSVLFDGEKARFPETMPYVTVEKRKRDIQGELNILIIKIRDVHTESKSLSRQIWQYTEKIQISKMILKTPKGNKKIDKLIRRFIKKYKWYGERNWKPYTKTEINDITIQIKKLNEKYESLNLQSLKYYDKETQLRREIYRGHEHLRKERKNTTNFVQKCSFEGCSGFLSENWSCELCGNKTCDKCLEIEDPDLHICDPDNVKTVKLIKQETQNCPGCGFAVHRVSGCNQMWCTQCHTTFDYTTGKKINGNIHNPHFFQWARENNYQPDLNNRNRQNICEQQFNVDYKKIHLCSQPKVQELVRYTGHIQNILQRVRQASQRDEDKCRLYRIEFMLQNYTEKQYKTKIFTIDNRLNKVNEYVHVLEFICTVMHESIFSIQQDYYHPNVLKAIKNIEEAKIYANKELKDICSAFGNNIVQIDDGWNVVY